MSFKSTAAMTVAAAAIAGAALQLLMLFTVSSHGGSVTVYSPRTAIHFQNINDNNYYLTNRVFLFNQTLDHFSPHDDRKFSQRYYEYLDHFRKPDGPIFLKICGESSCNGIVNDYLAILAKKFGAAIVSPEHRYYGKSSSFKSSEKLKYLSSKQALFDLAVFRQYYQESLNQKLNRTNVENPWFVFGVSYSGALSAWFRLKFPHLTCGSLASSGVAQAVFDSTDLDKQIGESAGPKCKAALQEVTHLVEPTGSIEWKSSEEVVRCISVVAFQYRNPDTLCVPLVGAKKRLDKIWWYHLDLCKNLFGEGVYPDVDATNTYYGGTRIAGIYTELPSVLVNMKSC